MCRLARGIRRGDSLLRAHRVGPDAKENWFYYFTVVFFGMDMIFNLFTGYVDEKGNCTQSYQMRGSIMIYHRSLQSHTKKFIVFMNRTFLSF